MGLRQIIDRAHQHQIKVFGATLTPFEGADYFTSDGEAIRQAVNKWIRTSGAFDGVVDFDAAVRDPSHPSQFREGYHSETTCTRAPPVTKPWSTRLISECCEARYDSPVAMSGPWMNVSG